MSLAGAQTWVSLCAPGVAEFRIHPHRCSPLHAGCGIKWHFGCVKPWHFFDTTFAHCRKSSLLDQFGPSCGILFLLFPKIPGCCLEGGGCFWIFAENQQVGGANFGGRAAPPPSGSAELSSGSSSIVNPTGCSVLSPWPRQQPVPICLSRWYLQCETMLRGNAKGVLSFQKTGT